MTSEFNAKFASFFINEVIPRQKKTGVHLDNEAVASLFVAMYRDGWPRNFVREVLDFMSGVPRKDSTLDLDEEYVIGKFNDLSRHVRIRDKVDD